MPKYTFDRTSLGARPRSTAVTAYEVSPQMAELAGPIGCVGALHAIIGQLLLYRCRFGIVWPEV